MSLVVCQITILKARLELEMMNNLEEEKELVGSSVKSENIKEFYNAKTYSSLYREVDIMTEESSKRISQTSKELVSLIRKF